MLSLDCFDAFDLWSYRFVQSKYSDKPKGKTKTLRQQAPCQSDILFQTTSFVLKQRCSVHTNEASRKQPVKQHWLSKPVLVSDFLFQQKKIKKTYENKAQQASDSIAMNLIFLWGLPSYSYAAKFFLSNSNNASCAAVLYDYFNSRTP